jgi:Cu/Ag efflux protein CusF
MKRSILSSIVGSALLALSLSSSLAAEDAAGKSGHLSRHDMVLVTITASVEDINVADRELTLKGPLGNKVTFIVDKRVKRLDEIKVGDQVQADYFIGVAAELRKPTAEEEKNPLVVLAAAGKAGHDESPAAAALKSFKAVTTIEGLDRTTSTITVKGPRGNYLTARVKDPSNFPKMRIGETIVVTYTEALAISVEKVAKKSAD